MYIHVPSVPELGVGGVTESPTDVFMCGPAWGPEFMMVTPP